MIYIGKTKTEGEYRTKKASKEGANKKRYVDKNLLKIGKVVIYKSETETEKEYRTEETTEEEEKKGI